MYLNIHYEIRLFYKIITVAVFISKYKILIRLFQNVWYSATGREKNPYTYFYVGRKLWYIPLFFNVYFMCYVFALVVRSIARHKIVFPSSRSMSNKRDLNSEQTELEDITQQVTTALEKTDRLYM